MDYEKKYKDALAKAREIHRNENEKRSDMEWLFPELKESEDERIRKELIRETKGSEERLFEIVTNDEFVSWLEKQGEQPSAIRWYDVSLIPQEMEELLVEWDSEDATWHEIAFYHADTKTFWNGTRQVENVTRWCYIIDLLEKQGYTKKDIDDAYLKGICDAKHELEKQGEQNPVGKPKLKFKVGDVLCDKSCTTLDRNSQPNIEILDIRDGMYICNNCSFPISQQDEYELVTKKIEPQSAWSDEDEKMYKIALSCIETLEDISNGKNMHADVKDWLKSLKDRIGG